MSKHIQAVLPVRHKEDVTSHQVEILLAIIGNLRPFVYGDVPEGEEPPEIDGGVMSAAEATIIKATDVLDRLLDDVSRWTCNDANAVQDSILETQTAHREFLEAQTKSAKEIQRPAFQHRPTLYAHEHTYYAVWGEQVSGACIVGCGQTPEAALLDFDEAFRRTPPEQIQLILQEPTPKPPLTVKPSKKKK